MVIKSIKRKQEKRRKEHLEKYGSGTEIRKIDEYTPEIIAEELRPKINLVPYIQLGLPL